MACDAILGWIGLGCCLSGRETAGPDHGLVECTSTTATASVLIHKVRQKVV